MRDGELVLSLLTQDGADIGSPSAWCRDLTIAWSRYGYRDAIVEGPSVDAILDEVAGRGHRHCLIQAPGILIRESWRGDAGGERDFLSELASWVEKHEFLVVGRIESEPGGWYGLDERCLLVDLERYRTLGRPRFGDPQDDFRELPDPDAASDGTGLRSLTPTGRVGPGRPGRRGWGLVEAALRGGVPVLDFDRPLREQLLDVAPRDGDDFSRYLGEGIARYRGGEGTRLRPDQRELLDVVALHAANARRGVFLWNIESTADVEQPPPGFQHPVSHLYSVAAGFKPNRILHTHGFDAQTRVTFVDYSRNALDVRSFAIESWDGRDLPGFFRRVFERFPHPETYYHLWRDLTPEQLSAGDLERAGNAEVERWGGEEVFARHWCAYRELRHEFVHCDLLGDPAPLLERVEADPQAVIWWSNAFFTVCSNWCHPWTVRRARYEAWISQLARRNPDLLCYGSDHNNTNVNWVRAGDYWRRYAELPGDALVPRKLQRHQIRM
jgi:hypothetical protein